ncbi:putative mechanosensitive ion channel MscS, LSM domain superfamily [Dioscorea sansibarensis]
MMDSLRNSFKPQSSYKRPSSRNPSFDCDHAQEHQPILSDHREEVIVRIDGKSGSPPSSAASGAANGNIWRGSSYDFSEQVGGGAAPEFSFPMEQDPPSKLISSFIRKQRASGEELSLDMDFEMEELKRESPKDRRVSFEKPLEESPSSSSEDASRSGSIHRRGSARVPTSPRDAGGGEVLRCTSNSSFRRSSTLLRVKTRSRLMDPAPAAVDDNRKSGKIPRSGQMKSGLLGKPDDDDDDPFLEEDLPDEFKQDSWGVFTILQLVSLILIIASFFCSIFIPVLERQTVWNLHLWKWELLVLVLICGRLVSGWVIRLIVFFIERNFLLRKRVLYFVYGLRKAVQNCLWLGLVLMAWHFMFDKKVERETESKTLPYVTKVLFCLLIATVFRLVKTLLVKVLASSFHVSTYFDRIQEALFNQYVIETLSGPPLVEIEHIREDEERVVAEVQKLQKAGVTIPNDLRAAALPCRSGRVIGGSGRSGGSGHGGIQRSHQIGRKSVRFSGVVSKRDFSKQQPQQGDGITINHLHKLNQKNVSAWNMKRLMRIVRHGTLATLDEQITDAGMEDESTMQIRSENEAKVAAKKIFNNVAKPGSKHIYLEDLMRFMRDDEAVKTMSLFEGAQETKRVTKRSLKNWVVNAFRERRALSLTLNDTKTAVDKLHQMANVVVGIIVFGLWLVILGIATTHFFVLISSQVLLAVFMFGNTLKTTFEAIIFLFVMHPFDVGDRCEIEGVQMIVEEMNILTTVFLRYDNMKIIYPNSLLSTKPISNIYRSPDMGDSIDFCVHVATPVQKLAIMKDRIKSYIESKKEHWYPTPTVMLRDVDDMNRLRISIWLQHRINYQDMGLRWARREMVFQEMIKVLRELDIEFRLLPLDVNVRDMPPLSSPRFPSTWTAYN